jgi:quercetin dioxygenase-like cupin family protein
MPVTYSKDIETRKPFDGVETKRMVDGVHGSKGITVISEIIKPGGRIPVHRHKTEAGIYVYEGRGHLLIEGEGEYEVEAGMGLLVPANSFHSMWNNGDADFKYITSRPTTTLSTEMKES